MRRRLVRRQAEQGAGHLVQFGELLARIGLGEFAVHQGAGFQIGDPGQIDEAAKGAHFGFRSGRKARKAAFSAAVRTLPLVWRETLGVGGAKVTGVLAGRSSERLLIGGFITPS